MQNENIVLDYIFDVTPDASRYHNMIHAVDINILCSDRGVRELFQDSERVSLRQLFNNLDGDSRSGRSYLKSDIAGTVLSIASFHYIHREQDDDEPVTERDFEDLHETIEEEFNNTFSCAIDNMCSYLFGRVVLTEKFRREEMEAYEQMYEICEDLLWTLVTTLADEVEDIANIAEIMINDKEVYPVALWEEDFIVVSFLSKRERISSDAYFTILNRGMTNAERYDNPHRRRS